MKHAGMKHAALRREIVGCARRMDALGIYRGTSGNISVRTPSGFLITPTGFAAEDLTPASIVEMGRNGRPKGRLLPSSEWRFHRDIYAERPDCRAVVHTHSTFATVLSCLRREIPPFHYMVAKAGGRAIACAPYATFGTEKLSQAALAALSGRKACLLANHGSIAVGDSLKSAARLAAEVEALAEQYWRALQAGEPVLLSEAEMDVVVEKFRTYGVQPGATRPRPAAGRKKPALARESSRKRAKG
ncbi:MAG: class II aldolase/adducin family protein [Alphaproteobacteria bacterium]